MICSRSALMRSSIVCFNAHHISIGVIEPKVYQATFNLAHCLLLGFTGVLRIHGNVTCYI